MKHIRLEEMKNVEESLHEYRRSMRKRRTLPEGKDISS